MPKTANKTTKTKKTTEDVVVTKNKPKNPQKKATHNVYWVNVVIQKGTESTKKTSLIQLKVQMKKSMNKLDAIDHAEKKIDKKLKIHEPYDILSFNVVSI